MLKIRVLIGDELMGGGGDKSHANLIMQDGGGYKILALLIMLLRVQMVQKNLHKVAVWDMSIYPLQVYIQLNALIFL